MLFPLLETTPDCYVVSRLDGDLDAANADELRAVLKRAPSPDRAIVVDLSGVTFIDSAGLAALIAGTRRFRYAGWPVVVVGARTEVLRLFHTTGFDRVVVLVATRDEALVELAPAV